MKLKAATTNPTYHVQSVDRALDILDCFSFQDRSFSLSEIALRTGLNKTTAKRLLANLTGRGYLTQDPQNKRYQLGLRLFELGGVVYLSFSARRAAAPHLSRLNKVTGLTVLMGVNIDDHLVYADKREGRGVIRVTSEIGWRRHIHYGMLGMVLMAFLPQEKVLALLKKYPLQKHTPGTIVDTPKFLERLAQIREQGYVRERGEAHPAIMGVAGPVMDYTRKVVAAVGVAVPLTAEESEERTGETITLVRETCEMISADLGYLRI